MGSGERNEDRLVINREEECCDMAAELIKLYLSVLQEQTRTRQSILSCFGCLTGRQTHVPLLDIKIKMNK